MTSDDELRAIIAELESERDEARAVAESLRELIEMPLDYGPLPWEDDDDE